jgi:hypothetical protein
MEATAVSLFLAEQASNITSRRKRESVLKLTPSGLIDLPQELALLDFYQREVAAARMAPKTSSFGSDGSSSSGASYETALGSTMSSGRSPASPRMQPRSARVGRGVPGDDAVEAGCNVQSRSNTE